MSERMVPPPGDGALRITSTLIVIIAFCKWSAADLSDHPLRYNLEPKGGMLQGKYRLGGSRFWAGLSYAFASTQVTFDAPPGMGLRAEGRRARHRWRRKAPARRTL